MEGEKQLSILCQKQGRAIQFSSKAARDKCLQKEIDDLERVLSSSLAQEQKNFRMNLNSLMLNAVFNHHKSQRDKLQDEHKSLWKNETELSAEIEKQIAAVEKAENCLDHATAGDVRGGLNFVRVSESIDGQSKQLRIIKDENTKLKFLMTLRI
ncbi:hypothetical protein L3X38_032381 [Prunus dulcis]|uniref:Uncharacterized protein n=1 Tax=Prunus dulcis TaxID=3755 RepID=A0AAD4VDW0_PRUDU|nr:hypothetical protein L3X38_032381 [Prunus dulcis]